MKFDPQIHQRRSIRLKGFDYTQAGAYFITIVTRQRECLFGEIARDDEAERIWSDRPRRMAENRPNAPERRSPRR
jgi:hypothetical protein